jgi:DNA repair exonuclease SbcCD ATPase subunit
MNDTIRARLSQMSLSSREGLKEDGVIEQNDLPSSADEELDSGASESPVVEPVQEEKAEPAPTVTPTEEVDDETAGLKKALYAERQNKKAAQAKAEKQSAETAELKSAIEELRRQLAAQKPNAADVSVDEDPIGYTVRKTEALEGKVSEIIQNVEQSKKAQQEQMEFNQKIEDYKNEVAEYGQIVPDYNDALIFAQEHMARQIAAEEAAFGNNYTLDEIHQIVTGRALAMLDTAKKLGRTAPEFFYEYAQKLGYQKASVSPKENTVVAPKQKTEPVMTEKFRNAHEVANSMSEGAPSDESPDQSSALQFSMKNHKIYQRHPLFQNSELKRAYLSGE